jgi:hypothetical protein
MTRPPANPAPNVNPAPVAPRSDRAAAAEDRLAAALKANMARRKAQARARAAGSDNDNNNDE